MKRNYDDIINRERPKLKGETPMLKKDRAAQFASFSALTGHKESLEETRKSVKEIFLDKSL